MAAAVECNIDQESDLAGAAISEPRIANLSRYDGTLRGSRLGRHLVRASAALSPFGQVGPFASVLWSLSLFERSDTFVPVKTFDFSVPVVSFAAFNGGESLFVLGFDGRSYITR